MEDLSIATAQELRLVSLLEGSPSTAAAANSNLAAQQLDAISCIDTGGDLAVNS